MEPPEDGPIDPRFERLELARRTFCLHVPGSKTTRLRAAIRAAARLACRHPARTVRILALLLRDHTTQLEQQREIRYQARRSDARLEKEEEEDRWRRITIRFRKTRKSCRGVMEAIAVWVRRDGEWAIVHRCRRCGKIGTNRIAGDDNEVALVSLAVRPLASPPLPLHDLGRVRPKNPDSATTPL